MKFLVTGGTNGMGKGVALALASANKNHEIIILCRSELLGNQVMAEISDKTGNKNLSIVLCDLSKLQHVHRAISEIQKHHTFLDGIFINAGLGYAPGKETTVDGMDPHFQVNYLSQFMLVLNLLPLLEKAGAGGRVIFNVTRGGKIHWDDLQLQKNWHFETAIHQAMVAKRLFLQRLHRLNQKQTGQRISFIGFEISKTVWSNQIAIIPATMRIPATIVKWLGGFISIEECGKIMEPLFTESMDEALKKSGKFLTWKKGLFVELQEEPFVLDTVLQDRLWEISYQLYAK